MGHLKCPENPIKDITNSLKANCNCSCTRQIHTTSKEPRFVPGYTGYAPNSGPHRHKIVGETYGQCTHELLHGHPVAGSRLAPLPDDLKFVNSYRYPPYRDPKQLLENPHKSLHPYFIPGYTGYVPGSGLKRCNGVGDTYARMSHVLMANDNVAGSRLRPIHKEPREYIRREEEAKFYCHKHEILGNDVKRRCNVVPGYGGHIPRDQFRHGKTKTKTTRDATAEFEKIMEKKHGILY